MLLGKLKQSFKKWSKKNAQCNLGRQTADIFVLSLGNVSKSEFLIGKDVLPVKNLLEKAARMKRFQYSPLGKDVKGQTDIAKKLYKKLDNTFEFDKIKKKKEKKN